LPRTGYDAHRVIEPLLRDLKQMEAEYHLAPQP
jgi:hypothetical protein